MIIMQAAVYSPYGKQKIFGELKRHGFSISGKNPGFVFVYGGDGSILKAEHLYPGIPKVPMRKSIICSKCRHYGLSNLGRLASAINAGKFRVKEETKIEAVIGGKRITALNEIQVRNADPRKALRFSLQAGKTRKEIIGDGFVAATPYGSTGYYRSMGYKPFKSGIRIGFNNVWPNMKPVKTGTCTVKIIRESAVLAADNFFVRKLSKGDTVAIRKSRNKARFVVV